MNGNLFPIDFILEVLYFGMKNRNVYLLHVVRSSQFKTAQENHDKWDTTFV